MKISNQLKLDDFRDQLKSAKLRLDKCPVRRGGVGKAANDIANTLANIECCARTENAIDHISVQATTVIDQANWIADRVIGNV